MLPVRDLKCVLIVASRVGARSLEVILYDIAETMPGDSPDLV